MGMFCGYVSLAEGKVFGAFSSNHRGQAPRIVHLSPVPKSPKASTSLALWLGRSQKETVLPSIG